MANTPNLGLPLIDSNMTADVPRDHNALVNALDTAIGDVLSVPTSSKEVAGAITELHQAIENIDVTPPDGSITTAKLSFDPATQSELDVVGAIAVAAKSKADAALPSLSYTAADMLAKIKTVDGAGCGLDADLLDGKHADSFVNSVSVGSSSDPNTTLEPYILTNHANGPGGGYWYIKTLFYSTLSTSASRAQFAFSYSQSSARMMTRRYYEGAWNAWREVSYGGVDFRINAGSLEYNDGGTWKSVANNLSTKYKGAYNTTSLTEVMALSISGPGRLVYLRAGTDSSGYQATVRIVVDGTELVNAIGPSQYDYWTPLGPINGTYQSRTASPIDISFKTSLVIYVKVNTSGGAKAVLDWVYEM